MSSCKKWCPKADLKLFILVYRGTPDFLLSLILYDFSCTVVFRTGTGAKAVQALADLDALPPPPQAPLVPIVTGSQGPADPTTMATRWTVTRGRANQDALNAVAPFRQGIIRLPPFAGCLRLGREAAAVIRQQTLFPSDHRDLMWYGMPPEPSA